MVPRAHAQVLIAVTNKFLILLYIILFSRTDGIVPHAIPRCPSSSWSRYARLLLAMLALASARVVYVVIILFAGGGGRPADRLTAPSRLPLLLP